MTSANPIQRSEDRRRGISSVEIIVAFTLLSGVLAASASLMVKHGRQLQAQRHYRLGLDELSNQIERISALPGDERQQAVENLEPSEFAVQHLPGAKLNGELQPADVGQRLVLRLTWDEPQRQEAPLTLAAWIFPDTADRPETAAGDERS